jgi:hypothetical protein
MRKIVLKESSVLSNPASGYKKLFVDTDGDLSLRDHNGNVSGVGSGGGSQPLYHEQLLTSSDITSLTGLSSNKFINK